MGIEIATSFAGRNKSGPKATRSEAYDLMDEFQEVLGLDSAVRKENFNTSNEDREK